MIDYKEIERKWQEEWASAKLFEGEVSDKPSYMVTAAFPYVNAPQHIGHMRTYGTADVLARYKRMQGNNVLYPMGFHATGTPILAFSKRLKNKDRELIDELHLFRIPDKDLERMVDPLFIADYFVKEIEAGMRRAGYSIDWRRKFVSIEPFFSKFIEWQFGILNSKGYLVKGRHPVGWCPNENNAVGMHDTKHDVQPEIDKETSIKFRVLGEEAYMLCTTYRPETIFGVTNVFVNTNIQYALCKIAGQSGLYYISKAASKALEYQLKIEVVKEVTGAELLSKKCSNPATNAEFPVLPGFFVKEEIGTGIVMSVPAHAPFDYAALEKLKASGYPMPEIRPIKVIELKGAAAPKDSTYIDTPALAYINMFAKGAEAADEMLEAATKQQYKDESHYGVMMVKGYEGMKEPDARARITAEMTKAGGALELYVLTNAPVYCRCGYQVVVKVVDDQWFINYADGKWKDMARQALSEMNVLPEKSRHTFESAMDWIDVRAAERAQGLGTRFPLNKERLIESLSDSTIYPSLYTISHIVRELKVESLSPEFFDFVLLGKGDIDGVAKSTGVSYDILKRCRDSFEYWYQTTSRHSGPDLIFNHLTMYIFNHVAVFDHKHWPKQIAVNGSVLSEGEKMSKSLGNIVPLMDGIEKYGADPLRFVVVASADLFSDSEFSVEAVNGVKERIEYLYGIIERLNDYETTEIKHIDYWLYSKLNRKIRSVAQSMDKLELRGVSTSALYDSVLELRRYFSRGGKNGMVIRDYMSAVVLMLAPSTPHICEELWHMLGNTSFASTEKWPSFNESMINDKVEQEEELIDRLIADTKQVIEIVRKKANKEPKDVTYIIAENWKTELNNALAKSKNIKPVIEDINSGKRAVPVGKELAIKYVTQFAKRMNAVAEIPTTQDDELKLLEEAREYISTVIKCKVSVEKEGASKSKKAQLAAPQRPAIELS